MAGADQSDARTLLKSLIGVQINPLTGQPSNVIGFIGDDVTVATDRARSLPVRVRLPDLR